ncbi:MULTISPECIES: hypothetical protein [unclassified Arenimonas]|uniref:hypothetical protein n=1 Tax=unclassified Arenimonas TaxID=2641713 RepID=UPI00086E4328|nr:MULTISPECIES: hypothetical protein [unclassified Arenimonas]ODS63906.1 MAG: hypothetical protein ABS41_04475 [Arenimonas sp. SCN 70-307]
MSRLLLALLLALAPLAGASGFDEVHAARVAGTITVDERGVVTEVAIDRSKLGDEVMSGLEDQVRGWRFEPVLDQGQPTQARLRLSADLLAFRQRGTEGLALAVSRARFSLQPAATEARPLAQPAYPPDAASQGIGADVTLMVRVGEGGKAEDAAVASLMLMGERAGAPASRERHAARFARSATEVAGRWQYPWAKAGETIEVNVRYTPPGFDGRRWVRAFPIGVDAPDWAVQAMSAETPPRASVAGMEVSSGVRLQTRLGSILPVPSAD